MDAQGFRSDRAAKRFIEFGSWALAELGAKKASLKIHVYFLFFTELETLDHETQSYEDMLRHFGAEGLRRAQVPMRWLTRTQGLIVDESKREQSSEERRVEAILAEPRSPVAQRLMDGYYHHLKPRVESGYADLRSIRIALRAASSLLAVAREPSGQVVQQKHLQALWRSTPGVVASVTGFVTFLNRSEGLELRPRPDARWLREVKKAKAERELVALVAGRDGSPEFAQHWIGKALAYFHGVRRVKQKALIYRDEPFEGVLGFIVDLDDRKLWVPSALGYEASRKGLC